LKSDLILTIFTKQHPNVSKNIRFYAVFDFFKPVYNFILDQF